MSSTLGPLYAGSAADGGGGTGAAIWATPSNATGLPNGTLATVNSASSNYLNTTGYGFAVPASAVIDGIMVEFDRENTAVATSQTLNIALMKAGSLVSTTVKTGTDSWPGSLAWGSYGGQSDLWGVSWTPADINNSGFGAAIKANTGGGGAGGGGIDAVRITVYWHGPIPQQNFSIYKVFDSQTNAYLGNLPNPINEFSLPQDINTVGSQITVQCGISADTGGAATSVLTDESGTALTDESSNTLTDEGGTSVSGIGTSSALIRNGNRVQVWEYGLYYPNGICMFRGRIERHEDNFGGDTGDNHINILIYSDSSDIDNYLVGGSPFNATDQSQTTQNASDTVSVNNSTWTKDGQTFTVGTGITNLGGVALYLQGTANVTVSIYTSTATTTLLGSVTQSVSQATAGAVQFAFPSFISVVAATQYFMTVSVDDSQSITIYYNTAGGYAGGGRYTSVFAGTGGSWTSATGSLYFVTYQGINSTTSTFTSVDPSTGMLSPIVSKYNTKGGLVSVGNIQSTGLSLSYGFNTNTVNEAVQGALSVSPSGFYAYVDVGYNLLYFQQANTVADFVLTKGVHISKLKIISTIEYIVNAAYVVGGVVSGSNIYTLDTDQVSIDRYGLMLQVHTDNNIPNVTTAHAVGGSIVASNKDEKYQSTITVPATTMDITLLIPGKVIGFNGFGTYVDSLLAQIVRREYTPGSVALTLGILPKRESNKVEQTLRGLTSLATITNPSSPS